MKGDYTMIEKLNDYQTSQLAVYRDKWKAFGMSTAPLNFDAAVAAVKEAYRSAGLPEPTRFEVADSPVDAIKVIQKIDPSMSANQIFNDMSFGNHDAPWLGFYEYFRDVCELECCNALNGMIELGKHSGWLNMYEDLVVFQHRPTQILMDDQERLHCDHGPAILYRDGFAVYAWHGVRIPAEWIEDKSSITPHMALTWENIEQRRAACEILGWNNILNVLDAKVIDADEDPMIGTLVEVDIPEIGREKFLRVMCGTGREFALPVPPEMKTALESNAWTFGMDTNEFVIPEVRT